MLHACIQIEISFFNICVSHYRKIRTTTDDCQLTCLQCLEENKQPRHNSSYNTTNNTSNSNNNKRIKQILRRTTTTKKRKMMNRASYMLTLFVWSCVISLHGKSLFTVTFVSISTYSFKHINRPRANSDFSFDHQRIRERDSTRLKAIMFLA